MAKSSAARQRSPEPANKPESRSGGGLESVAGSHALRLDRLIHERTRLAMVSALAASKSLSFAELKKLLDVTDGNLSVHARKLEDAGYIKCTKSFEKRFPKTEYRLTAEGRRALDRYLNHMEALIQATREA